jgi:hypothetical protein
MKDFITTDLNSFTQDELIQMFEAIRDQLDLVTIQNYKVKAGAVYNTINSRIKSGKLKATEVDGTTYIPTK